MSAQIKDGGAVDVVAVFDEASSWLPYDGDDNRIRERFSEACAAVAELIERDRVATEIFTCILRGVNDLDGPMGHRSEQYVAGWLGQWAKSMHAAGFKPLNPESRDITSALARVGGAK